MRAKHLAESWIILPPNDIAVQRRTQEGALAVEASVRCNGQLAASSAEEVFDRCEPRAGEVVLDPLLTIAAFAERSVKAA